MATYLVTRYWHTNEQIKVEADSEEEALEKSRYIDYDVEQIIDGLQEDSFPDAELLTEEE